jgi:1-acyl-sn-glycerol-3-phosphate acyltransferase
VGKKDMRAILVFMLLVVIHWFSLILFKLRRIWVGGEEPKDWWKGIRVLAVLNHTSLYEPLLVGFAPVGLLWDLANHGVLPVAEKTMKRPIGKFFNNLVRHVVVVTRQRDHTWERVLNHVDTRSLVMLLPEGRMKRRNGLDQHGRPMTVRGGIADILSVLPGGKMLLVYSGGLHHIQAPGDRLPRLFKPITTCMEIVDIAEYCEKLRAEVGEKGFKVAMIKDLERRRDAHCPSPIEPEVDSEVSEKVSE